MQDLGSCRLVVQPSRLEARFSQGRSQFDQLHPGEAVYLSLASYVELFTQRREELLALGRPLAYHGTGVGGERLLAWYGAGDTEYRLPGTDMVFMVSAQTAEFLRETRETTGALVFGRRTFDLTHGWGGKHPLDVPVFVVSGSVPPEWVYEGSPFTFVTDGLESALEQAQAVAGDKDVGVGAASIVQQCI